MRRDAAMNARRGSARLYISDTYQVQQKGTMYILGHIV